MTPAPSPTPDCSLILCTLNPHRPTLDRTLAALRAQTLPTSAWELLLIDNGSTPPLAPSLDLSWHPRAHALVEPTPGLLNARLCGVRHSQAPLLVFVDDDNLLAPDYIAHAVHLAASHPRVAVFSGQSRPEFSAPPPDWTRPYWPLLAVTEFSSDEVPDHWSPSQLLPNGAGMVARRTLMENYLHQPPNPIRTLLGRRGTSLMSAEDHDIALHAYETGHVTARFTALHLTHVIAPSRLTTPYLLRLITGMAASRELLNALHPRFSYHQPPRFPYPLRRLRHWLRWPSFERSVRLANLTGERLGQRLLSGTPSP